MNAEFFEQIMEGARNGDPFDEGLINLMLEDIQYYEEACEVYGPENGNARLHGRATRYLQEYLAFYGK